MSGSEDSYVQRFLNFFHVSKPHIAVRRYEQPPLAIAQFDDPRVFHTLFFTRFCLKVPRERFYRIAGPFQSSHRILAAEGVV